MEAPVEKPAEADIRILRFDKGVPNDTPAVYHYISPEKLPVSEIIKFSPDRLLVLHRHVDKGVKIAVAQFGPERRITGRWVFSFDKNAAFPNKIQNMEGMCLVNRKNKPPLLLLISDDNKDCGVKSSGNQSTQLWVLELSKNALH